MTDVPIRSRLSGPALFLQAYDDILWHREADIPPSRALKCIGLFNAIAWRNARGETVTNAHLADVFGLSKPGVLRLLTYLKTLGLVTITEDEDDFYKQHIIHAPCAVVSYLKGVCSSAGVPDEDGIYHGSDEISVLVNNSVRRILVGRTNEPAAFTLQAVGLFLVIAGMNGTGEPVTRATLARKLGMSENAFQPKLAYLLRVGVLSAHRAQVERNFGVEIRLEVEEPLKRAVQTAMSEWNAAGQSGR